MNFKDFYYNTFYTKIIAEDYESVVKQITKMIQNNNMDSSVLDDILRIYDTVDNEIEDGREKLKKDSDLVALTYLYMVGSRFGLNEPDDYKSLYATYLNSDTSVNKKLLSNYANLLQNNIRIRGLFKPEKREEKISFISELSDELIKDINRFAVQKLGEDFPDEKKDKVYEDQNIVIFRADSKLKCIEYGKNSDLCISTQSSNYYWRYRMGKMHHEGLGMTTYFVFWKTEEGELKPEKRILIDALGDENGSADKYSWNPISPNNDRDITKEQLIENFPVLKRPFSLNVFKFIPYGQREKRFMEIEEDIFDIKELDNYEDFEMFVQADHKYVEVGDWEYVRSKINDKQFRKLLLLSAELSKIIPKDIQKQYFTEKEIERYENKLIETPVILLRYFKEVYQQDNAPQKFIEAFAKDAHTAYEFTKLLKDKSNIPEILIDAIATDSYYALFFAKNVFEGNNIPDKIVKAISTYPQYSYEYTIEVLEGNDVPDIIIKGIANNHTVSGKYARYLYQTHKEVPDIILKSISEDSESSHEYAELLKGKNVPDIILQGIAMDPYESHLYAKSTLEGNDVPDIILNAIAETGESSFKFAHYLKFTGREVPEIIIDGLLKESGYAYRYAVDLLRYNKNINEKIFNAIVQNISNAYSFALELLIYKKEIPDILIQKISEHSVYSLNLAEQLKISGKDIPQNLINAIARDGQTAYLFAQLFNFEFEKIPQEIMNIIQNNKQVSEAAIQPLSTEVIRSNAKNMEEIENRNFAGFYAASSYALIRDSRLSGFIGEGIFNDSNELVGYGYGYRMGEDGEYDDLRYLDIENITFFSDNFKRAVIENGIETICPPDKTFYISNLVVDKPYRFYVKTLLNNLLNRINEKGYSYIAFDGLSDTIRLFDSARKASRLSGNNLIKLAEVDEGNSKLVLFYIK